MENKKLKQKRTPAEKKNLYYRRLRNFGILMIFWGMIFLVFGCGYYVFRNTALDFIHLDDKDTLRIIISIWLPTIGIVLVISGVALVSKFQYEEKIDA